jgi:hypothetical protein
MNFKVMNKISNFNSLEINKEIEYFVNNYNPKYNKLYKEILSGNSEQKTEVSSNNDDNINKNEEISLDARTIFIKQFSENPSRVLQALHTFANASNRNMAIILTILEIIGNTTSVYNSHNKSNNQLPSSNICINFNIGENNSKDIKSVSVNDAKVKINDV